MDTVPGTSAPAFCTLIFEFKFCPMELDRIFSARIMQREYSGKNHDYGCKDMKQGSFNERWYYINPSDSAPKVRGALPGGFFR